MLSPVARIELVSSWMADWVSLGSWPVKLLAALCRKTSKPFWPTLLFGNSKICLLCTFLRHSRYFSPLFLTLVSKKCLLQSLLSLFYSNSHFRATLFTLSTSLSSHLSSAEESEEEEDWKVPVRPSVWTLTNSVVPILVRGPTDWLTEPPKKKRSQCLT